MKAISPMYQSGTLLNRPGDSVPYRLSIFELEDDKPKERKCPIDIL